MLKEIGPKYGIKNKQGEILNIQDFRDFITAYLSGAFNHEACSEEKVCPFGEDNDKFPGDCALYVDKDKNGICDYSE